MAAILVMWLWPFDYHYVLHPNLDSYEMYYHLAYCIFGENAEMFLTKVTLAKVNKWPWPLAFICNEVPFISLPLEYNSNKI